MVLAFSSPIPFLHTSAKSHRCFLSARPLLHHQIALLPKHLQTPRYQRYDSPQMTLTPIPCVIGGAAIGIVTALNAVINGRVTGVSGAAGRAFKSIVYARNNIPYDDVLFVAGLIAGGVLFSQIMPASFSGAFVGGWARIVGAGLLVGFGSNMANGCTSGHGICGLARLSKRSIVNVITFMISAMSTAAVAGTANLYRSVESTWLQSSAPPLNVSQAVIGLMIVALVPLLLTVFSRGRSFLRDAASKFIYFFFGAAFAYGLALAQMTRSQKVVSFLDVTSPLWDPSLLFVFLGALPVAFLGFQWITRARKQPLLCETPSLPTSTAITKNLVAGGALFGIGWGLEGYCPGPALVNLGANYLDPRIWIFCAALAAGSLLSELRKRIILESKT